MRRSSSALDVNVTLVEPRDSMLDFIDQRADGRLHLPAARPRHGAALRLEGRDASRAATSDGCEIQLEGGRSVRAEMRALCRGPDGRDGRRSNLAACGLDAGPSRPAEGRSGHASDRACRTSMPRATSSAFRALPRPRWSRAASPPATRSARRRQQPPEYLPLRHLFGAGDVDRRHDRGGGRASAASPTNAASPASARPRAATSWGWTPAC